MVKKMIIPDLRNQGKQIDALKERLKLSELESTGLRAQIRSQDAVIQSQGKVIQGLKLKDDVATAASRMPWARIDEGEFSHYLRAFQALKRNRTSSRTGP